MTLPTVGRKVALKAISGTCLGRRAGGCKGSRPAAGVSLDIHSPLPLHFPHSLPLTVPQGRRPGAGILFPDEQTEAQRVERPARGQSQAQEQGWAAPSLTPGWVFLHSQGTTPPAEGNLSAAGWRQDFRNGRPGLLLEAPPIP